VAALVLVLIGALALVRDNRRAFYYGLVLMMCGMALILFAEVTLVRGTLSPFAFMVLHGVGLYLPYLAFHTIIFERLIAMTRDRGNVGYLLYLADSFGYLGYVVVLLARNALGPVENFLAFFLTLSWVIALACSFLLVPCWHYFARRAVPRPNPAPGQPVPAEGEVVGGTA